MKLRELFLKEDAGGDDSGMDAYGSNGSKTGGKTGQMHPHHKSAIKGLTTYPELPGWYYNMYRYGVAMAGGDENGLPETSMLANQMMNVAFTEEEAEMIKKNDKRMGLKGKQVTTSSSDEAENTHTTSPVAKPKRNKYGV